MTDEEEEGSRSGGRRKKDKDRDPPRDNSTPESLNPKLTAFIASLFRELTSGGSLPSEERAQFVVVTQLFGRSKRQVGDVLRRWPVINGEVSHEYCVALANEIQMAMQDESDTIGQPMSYRIEGINAKKGGSFASKTVEVVPQRTVLRHGADDEDDLEENPFRRNGGDQLRARTETVLADGRFYAEHVTTSLGGMIQLMLEQLKDKDKMIKELFDANISLAKGKNEAENHALDRELIREERKFVLEAKRKGLGVLAGLLPGVVRDVTKGKVNIPGGRTPESLAIESVLDLLSKDEEKKVFGDWTEEGKRLAAGVLSEPQVQIIVGVLREQRPPDDLDALLEGGEHAITPDQLGAIAGVVDDVEKFAPLAKILSDHRDKLAAKSAATKKGSA